MILDGPRAEIAPTLPVECQGQDLFEVGVAAALLMNNDKFSKHRSSSGVSKGHYDFDIVTDEAGTRLLITNACKYIEFVEIKKRRVQRTIDQWLPLLFAA